jgi:hypothetical protein
MQKKGLYYNINQRKKKGSVDLKRNLQFLIRLITIC